MAKLPLFSFNTGELAPELHYRADLQKFRSACKDLDNFLVLPQGGVKRRYGSEVIAKVADVSGFSGYCRIIPWEVDRDNFFLIVILGTEINIYTPTGALVETITSIPWAEADFDQIYYKQVYDVMYLAHGSYPLQKLSRPSQFTWTLAEHTFNGGPYDDINTTESNTITWDETAGTLTATNADTFTANDVGRTFKLLSDQELSVAFSSSTAGQKSDEIPAHGEVKLVTEGGTWNGELHLEISTDGGTNWSVLGVIRSGGHSNYEISREVTEFNALVRCHYVIDVTGTVKATIEVSDQTYVHYMIDAYTSDTIVEATALTQAVDGVNSYVWAKGAFSEANGYPTCVEIFEERLMVGGTLAAPATIYGSVTNDWENWQTGTVATSAIQFTLANDVRNRIRWMIPETQLVIGTDYGEWTIGTRDTAEALSGSNVNAKRHQQYGTDPVQPLLSADNSLYIEAGGRRLRSAQYQYERDGYISDNMSILAQHITLESKFKRLSYTRSPDKIIWALREDGTLYTFTHEASHQVSAWAAQPFLDGLAKDISSVLQSSGDELAVIVQRTNGIYLEVIRQSNDHIIDWYESFSGIIDSDVIALYGNESFTFWGEDVNEMDVPWSGQGVFITLDMEAAAVDLEDVVVKYNGTQINVSEDYTKTILPVENLITEAGNTIISEDGNQLITETPQKVLFWYPEGTDASLITVFDFTTPISASHWGAYDYSDCIAINVYQEGAEVGDISVKVSAVPVADVDLYYQTGKAQILILNQAGTALSDVTIEDSAGAMDIDTYIAFRPELFFSNHAATAQDVVYVGKKVTSILEPVNFFNFPDAGGPGTRNRINEVETYLVDSWGGEISTDNGTTYNPIKYMEPTEVVGVEPTLFSGKISTKSLKGFTHNAGLVIRNTSPFRMRVAAIAVKGARHSE